MLPSRHAVNYDLDLVEIHPHSILLKDERTFCLMTGVLDQLDLCKADALLTKEE